MILGKRIRASEEVTWEDVIENTSICLQNIGGGTVVNFPSIARLAHRMSPKIENIVGHDLPKNARVLVFNRKRDPLNRARLKQVIDKEAGVVGDVVSKGPTGDVGGGSSFLISFGLLARSRLIPMFASHCSQKEVCVLSRSNSSWSI